MALELVTKDRDGITVLVASGRITLGDESNQLRTKLKELLFQGQKRLVLDLANVPYIDSSGLGALVAGYTSARSEGASMKLAHLTTKLRDQLTITKLVTVFEVYNTVDEAVKSFGVEA